MNDSAAARSGSRVACATRSHVRITLSCRTHAPPGVAPRKVVPAAKDRARALERGFRLDGAAFNGQRGCFERPRHQAQTVRLLPVLRAVVIVVAAVVHAAHRHRRLFAPPADNALDLLLC